MATFVCVQKEEGTQFLVDYNSAIDVQPKWFQKNVNKNGSVGKNILKIMILIWRKYKKIFWKLWY